MLRNYFKTTVRNLFLNRFYFLINIFGLSVGIASCLFIVLYVTDEVSYDNFHTKANRIYRINLSTNFGGKDIKAVTSPPPIDQVISENFPEVESTTQLYQMADPLIVRYQESVFNESHIIAADSNFFKVFDFKLMSGDAGMALLEPNTVVLTKTTANKYFGSDNPIGKLLTIKILNEEKAFKVTAVAEDPPVNSHFHFDMLTSLASYDIVKRFDWSWVWCQLHTYIVLKAGMSPQTLEAKFPTMVKQYAAFTFERIGLSFDQFKKDGGRWKFFLQPLTDIHLHSDELVGQMEPTSRVSYVYIFIIIALFIIFIACINFINFSTANSSSRAKEVGVRKVLGSSQSSLVRRFLTETMLISVISMCIATVLIWTFIGPFNQVSSKTLSFNIFERFSLVGYMILITIFVGFVSGIYPAFYLTSFKPIEVLKGKIRSGTRSGGFRSGLVIFQFVISIGLIICTLIVYKQLSFVQTKSLGFAKENVIIIKNADWLTQNREAFREDISSQSQVESVSFSHVTPARQFPATFFRPDEASDDVLLKYVNSDQYLVPTLQLEVVAGRNFSENFPTDKEGILLNEAAAKLLGWKDPIGKHLLNKDNEKKQQVIGVIKNFNYESLRKEIEPMVVLWSDNTNYVSIRVRPGNMQNMINMLEDKWKTYVQNAPFEYTFLDEDFDALFRAEQRLGRIFSIFTVLAILIASLGLVALAAFTAKQRTKEIGIRKVMGASVWNIVLILSKEYAKLILIAFVIVVPISYYTMSQWLQNFVYRTNISVAVFLFAGILTVLYGLLVVSYQTIKTAQANPIHSLSQE